MSAMVSLHQVSLCYANKKIFVDVNLELSLNKWSALIGPSGVGKSSLLRMIAGLTSKNAQITGQLANNQNILLNQQIAYMAQNDALLPWLNVIDNCLIGYKLRGCSKKHYIGLQDKAQSLLKEAGLTSCTNKLYPKELSGGMRQRVALVRTFLEDKNLILMDEPFSALDALNRYKLHELAVRFLKHKCVLFITHDPLEALRLADEIYLLKGKPATLKSLVNLSSNKPRALDNLELQQHHQELLAQMLQEDK